MSNVWSNVGADIAPRGDEWLYRCGEEIRGPLAKDVIVQRLIKGELDMKLLVAREGGEFHPIAQVKAFEPYLEEVNKAIKARNAGKTRVAALVGLVVLLIAGAGAGWYFMQRAQEREAKREKERQEAQAKLEEERKALDEIISNSKSELVALVTFDVKAMKVGGKRPTTGRRPRKGKTKQTGSVEESTEMVASCQRSQQEIFGTLGRHLAKINVCVQDEKSRNPTGLPAALPLDFIIKPDGKIVEFEIGHRHFRTGPMKNCMIKAFRQIRFPAAGGTTCPVSIPIKIGG